MTKKLNPQHSAKFKIKIWKISRRSSRSSDNPEFGNFTVVVGFAEDGKEMYQELQLFRERLSNKTVRDNAERHYG